MSGKIREQIRTAWSCAGLPKVSDDILSKCAGLASTLQVTPTQMALCWDAYSINKQLTTLDEHSFAAFRLQLIKDSDGTALAAASSEDGAVRPTKKRDVPSVMITPAHNKRQQQGAGSANASGNRRVSLSPNPPWQKPATTTSSLPAFSERQGSGKVVVEYNPYNLNVANLNATLLTKAKCVISKEFPTNVDSAYRHFFTVLDERAAALDDLLRDKLDEFSELYNFGSEQIAGLEAVGVPRQETVCCIGRICNAAHEGRINATSVLLEGSRHMSGGARVEVDLTYLNSQKQSYSLFPGQIVAVEGMNCSGRKLVAHRICEGAPHAPVKSAVSDLLKFHHGDDFQGGAPLKIITASGPFTCSDNLEYEPLLDLIHTVSQKKPDVVILTGPFVDMHHRAVAAGQTTLVFEHENGEKEEILVPFEAFFANKISGLLEELYLADDSIQTQFVLVPSLDDATAEWVYPQAPFADRRTGGGTNLKIPGAEEVEVGTLGLHHIETAGRGELGSRRVHCVSNPCTLKINEVLIGVTATDVLFHMSADETNANLEAGSRMGRLAQHMLQQRSYYPLFPGSSNTNLDLKRIDQWKMPCALDLLILPSKLAPFASTVLDCTVVVNPGLLTRASMGGTYAVFDVHPIARDTLENAGGDAVELKHNLQERTRVEIKRI